MSMTVASGVLAWLQMNHQTSKTWEILRESSSSFNRSCYNLFSISCMHMSVWSLKKVDDHSTTGSKWYFHVCMTKNKTAKIFCQYCLTMWVHLHKIRFLDQNYCCQQNSDMILKTARSLQYKRSNLPCVLPSLRSFLFVSLWFLNGSNSLSKGSISCKKTEQRNVKLF